MNDLEQTGIDSPAFRLRNGSLGLSLRFSREALSALTAEIGAGFMSIPRRGAEVGGILAGEMAQKGSEWSVSVDRIIPVSIQYQFGPSWRLSAADKHEFQQLVHKGCQSSRLIGWFRSNTRPEHEPEEADRQISQTFFPGDQSIFLFCEPSADGQVKARCIIVLPRRVEVAFAFEVGKFSRLEALFHSRNDDASEAAPVLAPAIPGPLSGTAPAAPRRTLVSRNVKIAVAALAMTASVWYARGHVFTATTARADAGSMSLVPTAAAASPAPAPATPAPLGPRADYQLGLRADYQKDSLLIGWNRAAPVLASAASATFRIADAGRTRILDLSARELQNGSIVYKPKADEISVELNVTARDGATASQSIRIIGATPEPSSKPEPAPKIAVQHSHVEQSRLTVLPRPFQPPPDVSRAEPREVATPDVPPVGDAPTLNGNQPGLIAGSLPSLPQGLPRSTETRREFRPPQPVRSPQPVLPAGTRLPDYAYDRPVQIQVEVNIGADGSVTAARLTGESGAYAGLLGPSALNTARMWRFRPAALGGQAIPSTMVLTFRFARPR
jgi:outer membrane biosynthesis protein TonB